VRAPSVIMGAVSEGWRLLSEDGARTGERG